MGWLLAALVAFGLFSSPRAGASSATNSGDVEAVRRVADEARSRGMDPRLATALAFWPGMAALAQWMADRGLRLVFSPEGSKKGTAGPALSALIARGAAMPVDLYRSGLAIERGVLVTADDRTPLPLLELGLKPGPVTILTSLNAKPTGCKQWPWRQPPPEMAYEPHMWVEVSPGRYCRKNNVETTARTIRVSMRHWLSPASAKVVKVGKDYEGSVGSGIGGAVGAGVGGPVGGAIGGAAGGIADAIGEAFSGTRRALTGGPDMPAPGFPEYWSGKLVIPYEKPAGGPWFTGEEW